MSKYLPKSQIKSNLYTKGKEYQYPLTQKEYKGYYYFTSTNRYFTGKHPGDFPNDELVKIENISATPTETSISTNSNSTSWLYQGSGYNKVLNNPPSKPKSIYPNPQDKDYKLGEFERYFLSKSNEIKFIETNQNTYNKYLNQSPDVSYQLYQPFKLSWELTGNREEVYKVNLSTVQRVENDFELRGFTQYFKNRFDQFYKELG